MRFLNQQVHCYIDLSDLLCILKSYVNGSMAYTYVQSFNFLFIFSIHFSAYESLCFIFTARC